MTNIKIADAQHSAMISALMAKSWRKAYIGMISQDYLDRLPDDRWLPFFNNLFETSGFETALYYLEGDEYTGCITYGRSRDEQLEKLGWGEIMSLYVLPEYWGKKQGKALMDFALSSLKQRGFARAYVWVLRENMRAIAFYEASGFEPDHIEIELDLAGEKLVDLRYSVEL